MKYEKMRIVLYLNTMPFYIRDLRIPGFWWPWGSWNQSSCVPREYCVRVLAMFRAFFLCLYGTKGAFMLPHCNNTAIQGHLLLLCILMSQIPLFFFFANSSGLHNLRYNYLYSLLSSSVQSDLKIPSMRSSLILQTM